MTPIDTEHYRKLITELIEDDQAVDYCIFAIMIITTGFKEAGKEHSNLLRAMKLKQMLGGYPTQYGPQKWLDMAKEIDNKLQQKVTENDNDRTNN